ncbi:MAG TPA: efflux RND transporter periplasmic adaptor subunit, partial [Candidatus Xenobia bacterium]|jgi:RND family efflux transporter MFP subunit
MQGVDESIISARQTGYLARYLVDIGDRVRKGQLLAVLTSPDTDQQLAQARAQAVQSGAAVSQSRSDEVRLQAATSAARAQAAQATAQLSHAQAAQAQAAAQVAAASRQVAQAQAAAEHSRQAERLAQRTWLRNQQLLNEGFVSTQDADQFQAAWKEAQADLVAAQRGDDASAANLKAQQAAFESSKADVVAARANVQSARDNVAAAAASQQSGQSAIAAAVANQQAVESNLQRNQTLAGFERVVAPFDGRITNRYADAGTLITADGSNKAYLFGLSRRGRLRVQVHVPESYALALKVGQPATMTVKELPGQTFPSVITKVSDAFDPTTRTELVEVWTHDDAHGKLLPGMYANVTLKPPMKPSLHIPGTALITDSRGTGVDLVTPQHTVQYKEISLGRDYGAEVEVVNGLEAKDLIVDTPSDTLKDGQQVDYDDPDAPASSAPTPR